MEHLGIETIELKQKVADIRKQCNNYDILLKNLSMPYLDFPPNMQKDLEQYAQFKRTLGFYAMDSTHLLEFYCTNTEKNIEKKIAIQKAMLCNEQIEKELSKIDNKLVEAKSFNVEMRNELKRYGNFDRLMRDANQEKETFFEKKNKMKETIKVDLDRILMKLEQLE